MANNVVQNETGTYVLDERQGYWRRASQQEIETIEKPAGQVVGESFLNNFKGLAGLVTLAGGPGIEGKREGLRQLMQSGAEQDFRSRLREQPTAIGTGLSMVLDPLNLVGYAGARKGATTMAQRVASRVDDAARAKVLNQAATPPSPMMQTLTEQAGHDALRSVGASEVMTPSGLRGLMDLIFEPGELTAQQRALLPVADRVGFRMLPGQADGNRLFLESLQSHPITAQAFAFELGENADQLRKLTMRALGVSGADNPANFTREVLRLSRQEIGGRFNQVREMIPEGQLIGLSDDAVTLIDDLNVLNPSQRRINMQGMTGDEAFQVRTRLNKRMADYYRNAETTAGDDLAEVIEELDGHIHTAIGPEGQELWRTARQQWRVRLAMKKPGVITPDGDVSLKALTRNLEKQFEREFGEALLPDDAFRQANPAIANLMDFTRVARSFASNLPDSGTATRQTIGRIMSGDFKEVAIAAGVRKLVEGTARLP